MRLLELRRHVARLAKCEMAASKDKVASKDKAMKELFEMSSNMSCRIRDLMSERDDRLGKRGMF